MYVCIFYYLTVRILDFYLRLDVIFQCSCKCFSYLSNWILTIWNSLKNVQLLFFMFCTMCAHSFELRAIGRHYLWLENFRLIVKPQTLCFPCLIEDFVTFFLRLNQTKYLIKNLCKTVRTVFVIISFNTDNSESNLNSVYGFK